MTVRAKESEPMGKADKLCKGRRNSAKGIDGPYFFDP